MFSREEVVNFVMQNFEPAWESVRPVPIVRIDFGNGNVVTRTLHGNIASYVCAPDGQVLDILPGIYTPAGYNAALQQLRALADAMSRLPTEGRLAHLRTYHRQRAQNLRIPVVQIPAAARMPRLDVGKGRFEMLVEQRVVPARFAQDLANSVPNPAAGPMPRTASELATWQPLVQDTRRNETERRLLIHDRFATADAVQPEQIKRWLYRDVLHADLDDPHMGLGQDFFADLER